MPGCANRTYGQARHLSGHDAIALPSIDTAVQYSQRDCCIAVESTAAESCFHHRVGVGDVRRELLLWAVA